MTKDDVIAMAEKLGMFVSDSDSIFGTIIAVEPEDLEAFALLVADRTREEDATIVNEWDFIEPERIAEKIRAKKGTL